MLKIKCKAHKLREYIDSYEYIHKDFKYPGFLKPKKEFEECYNYIVRYYDIFDDDMNKMIKAIDKEEYKLSPTSYIFDFEYFDFVFPDEETALYFILKFNLT